MEQVGVPRWYVDSLQRVKELANRAHVVQAVKMAVTMGWFKLNYPDEFRRATEM